MRKSTLCWNCSNTCGGCSWTRDFTPVEGWQAKEALVKNWDYVETSFTVIKCPQFKPLVKFKAVGNFNTNDYLRYKEFGGLLNYTQKTLIKTLLKHGFQQTCKMYNRGQHTIERRINKIKLELKNFENLEEENGKV